MLSPDLEAQLLAVATERLANRPYALYEFKRQLHGRKTLVGMTGRLVLATTDLAWAVDTDYRRKKLVGFVDAWIEGARLVEPLVVGDSSSPAKGRQVKDTAPVAATNPSPRMMTTPPGVSAADIVEKFKLDSRWADKLSHINRNPFLRKSGALMSQGRRKSAVGAGMPNLFNPVKFAEMLIKREGKSVSVMTRVIQNRFKDWEDEWDVARSVDAAEDWGADDA